MGSNLRFNILLAFFILAFAMACAPQGSGAPAATSMADRSGQPARTSAAAPLKVAMIMPGPIQDADFNALGAQALEQIKRQTGAETAFSESVAVADAERVGREYLNSSYNVVLYHGAQFLTIVQKLAPAFPSANFAIVSSAKLADLPSNVWNIRRKFHEGFYAVGVLAAASSQSKKIGYVSGVKLPEFVASLNAVKQAAGDTKPGTQVVYAFVGDQNDPVKARQAAASQIDSGADIIVATVNLGVSGVSEAAKAASKPVFFTTFYTEKRELAPDRLMVSLLADFSTPYLGVIKAIQGGTRGGDFEMRPGSGLKLSEIRNAPFEAAQKAQEAFEAIASGKKDVPEITDKVLDE